VKGSCLPGLVASLIPGKFGGTIKNGCQRWIKEGTQKTVIDHGIKNIEATAYSK